MGTSTRKRSVLQTVATLSVGVRDPCAAATDEPHTSAANEITLALRSWPAAGEQSRPGVPGQPTHLEEEVEVGGAREHLPEELGQEGGGVVFGGLDVVGGEPLGGAPAIQLHRAARPRRRRLVKLRSCRAKAVTARSNKPLWTFTVVTLLMPTVIGLGSVASSPKQTEMIHWNEMGSQAQRLRDATRSVRLSRAGQPQQP